MARDPRAYLYETLKCAKRIETLFAGKTLHEYLQDEGLREQVQWNLAVIGESLIALRNVAPHIANNVEDLPGSLVVRNFLVPIYHKINDEELWDETMEELPALIGRLKSLLQDLSE